LHLARPRPAAPAPPASPAPAPAPARRPPPADRRPPHGTHTAQARGAREGARGAAARLPSGREGQAAPRAEREEEGSGGSQSRRYAAGARSDLAPLPLASEGRDRSGARDGAAGESSEPLHGAAAPGRGEAQGGHARRGGSGGKPRGQGRGAEEDEGWRWESELIKELVFLLHEDRSAAARRAAPEAPAARVRLLFVRRAAQPPDRSAPPPSLPY
jgi:hypothetical protein